MGKQLLKHLSNRYVGWQIIFIIDIVLSGFLLGISFWLRYGDDIFDVSRDLLILQSLYVVSVNSLFFFYFKTFRGVVRHTSIEDLIRICSALFFSSLLILTLNAIDRRFVTVDFFEIPYGVIVINFILTLFVLTFFRISIKLLYWELKSGFLNNSEDRKKVNVLIYGAGDAGLVTLSTLQNMKGEGQDHFVVKGFVDDNPSKIGKIIRGIKIYSPKQAFSKKCIRSSEAEELIIAVQNMPKATQRKIVDQCLALNLKVKKVPPVGSWMDGELDVNQIKEVSIEDLLDREPINLDIENVNKELHNKVVLVTGAAGSIGSEIVRQVISYRPKLLVMIDQAESALYDIQMELHRKWSGKGVNFLAIVSDISREARMNQIFDEYKPEYVFHAAAYKHVPLMEENSFEAIRVNVFGTKCIADLSVKYAVQKFVMVSTDKAVNPTNVMGATKRLAECYAQGLNQLDSVKTGFITTRFGNVLGSNGSVIPLFKKQMAEGGPLTVTDKDIIRYFMTIPEACQLVLEAGAMGTGGEVFVFDMGEPVKIYDLAKKMIKLSGLKLGEDIEIEFTGLRPGEKLYEELLNDEENTLPTHHHKIMIAKVRTLDFDYMKEELDLLRNHLSNLDEMSMIKTVKTLIPEFKSKNSKFENLDN